MRERLVGKLLADLRLAMLVSCVAGARSSVLSSKGRSSLRGDPYIGSTA
jgi:hypothetical protein